MTLCIAVRLRSCKCCVDGSATVESRNYRLHNREMMHLEVSVHLFVRVCESYVVHHLNGTRLIVIIPDRMLVHSLRFQFSLSTL